MLDPADPIRGISTNADSIFIGASEMARLCLATNWAATPLGPVAHWPQSLRTAAGLTVAGSFPMMLAWGPDLIQIYNDEYRALLGTKHPAARNDLPLVVNRYGTAEDVHFTFSYIPVPAESGDVGGVLDIAFETTQQVEGRRPVAEAN